MKAEFYDVKARAKIEVEIEYKKKYENGHYGIFGKTSDGRNLPKFVSEADYNGKYAKVPVFEEKKEEKKAAAPKAKKCGCCKAKK